jgi:hypothetical protein
VAEIVNGLPEMDIGSQKRKTNMKPHFEINNKFFHIHLFSVLSRSNEFGKRDIRLAIDTKLFHLLFALKTNIKL